MNLAPLLKIPLFRSLDEAELERIFAELKTIETRFKKGDILAMQEESCNRLIILLTGSVTGEMADEAGRVTKVEDVEAPSPIAILFLFGAANRFPVQVTALEDGTAAVIPRVSVLRMLSMNEVLLKNYLDISADFATRLSNKLNMMSLNTIRQKLAVWLLGLSKRQGSDTVVLDKTKSALADYFGIARPSLERELTAMQRDGLIAANRKTITLLSKKALAEAMTK
ncbi:MAG: Crp/Fnr family transcriptional regulator [Rikenellaceae bacterium]|jgi:CRP-like cAMP-binding protein|nr:Crp/Fnr family transcriptional regulator [Rikenellaceae bacterium]